MRTCIQALTAGDVRCGSRRGNVSMRAARTGERQAVRHVL